MENLGKKLSLELQLIYGHIGHKKVYKMIEEDFVLEGLKRKVHQWLRTCEICQKVKYKNSISQAPL